MKYLKLLIKKQSIFYIIIFLTFFTLACPSISLAQVQFGWVNGMGSAGNDVSRPMLIDTSGNVYISGPFTNTVDFDTGSGTTNLVSIGGGQDIFVAKYDSSGTLLWAKQMGGSGVDISYGLAVDASGIYITGEFASTADFDPGTGTSNLTSAGASDIFISKLDLNGDFVWVKQLGGTGTDKGKSIRVDTANIYTTGYFNGTADFDPSGSTSNLISGGIADVYIAKYDLTGALVWAKQIGSTGDDQSFNLAIDSENVYTIGYFNGTVDFDPGAGTSNLVSGGGNDIFISKLDLTGAFVWAKQIGSTGDDQGYSIKVDTTNIYTTGYFNGTVDFDPGAGTSNLVSGGVADIFISKLDLTGAFVWAKQIGSTGDDQGYSVAIDSTNVYATGYFNGTVDFDPGVETTNITSTGGNDIYIVNLDLAGDFIWVKQIGGAGSDIPRTITSDESGNVYIAGQFASAPADFDPDTGTYNLSSIGGNDIFILKLNAIIPDITKPIITLLGSNHVSLVRGQSYIDAGATALDDIDGDITSNISIVNPVDINTVGTYTITYNVSDTSLNSADEITRTVIVTSPPKKYGYLKPRVVETIQNPTPVTPVISNQTYTKYIFSKILKYKMNDNEVRELQKYLNNHGYPISKIGPGSLNKETTYFGPKTKASVILFQKENNLTPDGIVGKITIDKINSLNF